MSVPPPINEWWNLPVGQIPESAQLEDMPPLLQALVRRNADLRRRLLACQADLRNAGPEAAHQRELRIAELESRLEASKAMIHERERQLELLQSDKNELMRSNLALKEKLDNFRQMIQRRDQKIAKLRKM